MFQTTPFSSGNSPDFWSGVAVGGFLVVLTFEGFDSGFGDLTVVNFVVIVVVLSVVVTTVLTVDGIVV